ncbi:spermatogenesis-associated protein 22-like [Acanthaster planci]|uniref:Spermatogenesis-associated protein 22-like n=1 Tax=Acanthaster planci TaxID=133434 RepID=A0A8B7YLN9_ACAPL|nr:spermatogenesis-associated protein 22-like [Acanthaster planci]XP_022093359.1 spermatogenesis-associated protein 22-like [Acanthaster planci]XP_022093360.1 spermatogenesis-associated protein 22-like [Acanthaster planci]XP_022093361.1 spermatogenesis-associated protein 22-like [Acanthaster planci]XP_022093362.1 spermatogenesis-associated protein 22-like [Acanthaster planci]
MQEKKKVPPSFDRNKRPRQALFPHPKNENTNNADFRGNFSQPSASYSRPAKQPRIAFNTQKPAAHRQLNNSNFNNWRQPWNGSSNSRGNFPASSPPNPWSLSAQAPGYGVGGRAPSGVEAACMDHSGQQWAGPNSSFPPNRPNCPPFGNVRQAWTGPGCVPKPRFQFQSDPSRQRAHWQQNSRPPHQPAAFSSQSPRPNAASNRLSVNREGQQDGSVVDDRSLKVLTASIADMRDWSQHMDKLGSMVCEVFGIMNSAISSDVNGVAKMFTLKDEDQTLKCIFYETDRPLPRLIRDQWLRCTGSLEQRSGLFRCVSVRAASQAERQVVKSLMTASARTMRERLAAVQEP